MLVVTRYTVPAAEAVSFQARARGALAAFRGRPGYRAGRLGQAVDDPTSWVLTLEWESVGSYRRALSAYDVRVEAVPLLGLAHQEPSAYELRYVDGPPSAPGG